LATITLRFGHNKSHLFDRRLFMKGKDHDHDVDGFTCSNPLNCNIPGAIGDSCGTCEESFCFIDTSGNSVCLVSGFCSESPVCSSNSDCLSGRVCVPNTCCFDDRVCFELCQPNGMAREAPSFLSSGNTITGRTP